MPVVKCHLENASTKINGVPFEKSACGTHMVTPEIPADIAARFDGIPGYEMVGADAPEIEEPVIVAEVSRAEPPAAAAPPPPEAARARRPAAKKFRPKAPAGRSGRQSAGPPV